METPTEVVAYVALPGVEIADVRVSAENGVLLLCGQRRRPPEWRSAGLLCVELPWGPFERRVKIPEGCTLARQQAMQGYLVIHLRKPAPEKTP